MARFKLERSDGSTEVMFEECESGVYSEIHYIFDRYPQTVEVMVTSDNHETVTFTRYTELEIEAPTEHVIHIHRTHWECSCGKGTTTTSKSGVYQSMRRHRLENLDTKIVDHRLEDPNGELATRKPRKKTGYS